MMEEVNDDTNGESTFEFVGDKTEDAGSKEPVSSSTHVLTSIPPSTPPVCGSDVSSSFAPTAQGVQHGLFPPAAAAAPSSGISSSQLATDPATNAPPVPMYNPAQQAGMSSASFGPPPPIMSSPQAYNLMSPMPPPPQPSTLPYVPPGQGYVASPPTMPKSAFEGPSVGIPQAAALDLPVDDSYVSSTTQSYQAGGSGSERGVWGWIKGNEFLNKVAEKAKSSVDSVITTLDPGMKEIIYSGGDISLVVASNSDAKVSAIREAFQSVFGKATVEGLAAQSTSIAPQPVGFSAGVKAAEERINSLRQQGLIPEYQAVVAVENFLAELTPDNWFDLGVLMLVDPNSGTSLQVYTQAVPVDLHFVMQAKEQTPPDYPLGWSGYAVTIGQIVGTAMGVHHSAWHQALTGVPRRDMLLLAAKTLAGMYKNQLRR